MKTTALVLSAATLTVLTLVPAMAQQTTGAPGSPSATTTIDGKYLPPQPPQFGGEKAPNPIGRRKSCRQKERPTFF
jgi:hypothetical protein